MNIYDPIIENIAGMFGSCAPRRYPFKKERSWEESDSYELVLQKEMAFELGGDNKSAVAFTCVTDNPKYFNGDEILLYGSDLREIRASSPFARIVLLLTENLNDEETDSERLLSQIQAMDFVKYHVYPKGYMVRTSGRSFREQVRVSKKGLRAGMSFERIGDTFILGYKKNKKIKNVKIIFITAADADYSALIEQSKQVSKITHSMSRILDGIPMECGTCSIRNICDEVEGLKELHFGNKNKK